MRQLSHQQHSILALRGQTDMAEKLCELKKKGGNSKLRDNYELTFYMSGLTNNGVIFYRLYPEQVKGYTKFKVTVNSGGIDSSYSTYNVDGGSSVSFTATQDTVIPSFNQYLEIHLRSTSGTAGTSINFNLS